MWLNISKKILICLGTNLENNMAIISKTKKFVFCHIPKTAGSSIRRTLMGFQFNRPETPQEWHENMSDTKKRVPEEEFNQMFKFTFVRNPWERLVSTYNFICSKPIRPGENIPQEHYKAVGFKKWLLEEEFFVPNNIPLTPDMVPMQRRTLVDWIDDKNGECLIDFFGRFETVDKDFAFVCERIGISAPTLPKVQVGPKAKPYRDMYDQETLEYVGETFKKDIERFNFVY